MSLWIFHFFENELQNTVDEVWLVYTSESIQIERLMERNQLSLEDAKARVYSQISIDKRVEWQTML